MMKSWKKKTVDPDPVVYQGQQLILAKDLEVKGDLGEGQYGVVQLGLWKPQNGTNPKFVAIKSLKNADFEGVLTSVLKEAQTMQKLCHSNIVTMYGISLPYKDEPLKLVTEFASYGSLEKSLKEKNSDVCRVSTLSKFAFQVAEGMSYLASQNLVHLDLATRNILVFEPDLVKISDFGLARTLEGQQAAKMSANRKFAIAWLPPEAIRENVFTLSSDVWSYGITLWEMFSFGEKPWEQLPLHKIKRMIANEPTNHLPKPDACPDGFYEIMVGCWEPNPRKRPPFEYISNKVSQLQPTEGITKVGHITGEHGHLSYDCKVKVTVISKGEEGSLLVQSENGSIGLVDEKNVDFTKKAHQKWTSGTNVGHIGSPYNIKKQTFEELMAKLQMKKAVPFSQTTKKAVVDKEVVRKPLIQTVENGEAHKLIEYEITAQNGAKSENFNIRKNPNAATNDGDNVTLKDMKGPQHLIKRQDPQMHLGTQTESGTVGPVHVPDTYYAVPRQQHRKGSKGDAFLGLGLEGTPGGDKSPSDVLSTISPPDIPDRPDLQENTLIAAGGAGSSATSPRGRRPVPTPRSYLRYHPSKRFPEGQEPGGSVPVSLETRAEEKTGDKKQLLEEIEDQPSGAHSTLEQTKKDKLDVVTVMRPTYANSKETVQPVATQNAYGQEISSKPQAPLSPVEQLPNVTDNSDSSQLKEVPLYENTDEVNEVDLIDLSSNPEDGVAKPKPLYDIPIKLPDPPYVPPEVLVQPPPLPEKTFGGTLGRDQDTSYQLPVRAVGGPEFNPAFQPFNPAFQRFNPVFQHVYPVTQLVKPVTQPVNPAPQPFNPAPKPVSQAAQAVNPGGATKEGAYGEEIDAKILRIRQLCGEEVPRDWCYAALLQYQGDIEQVVPIIKTQKLSKLTGKSEQFCQRTLSHCNWDLDRAAGYILDDFENRDV
ncbi:uncharacterized protein LOC144658113 isoform X2 [Oculina patagonica]